MNTIEYPKSVKARLAKYDRINARSKKVLARGVYLTPAEIAALNGGFRQNMSDEMFVLARK